MNLNISLGFVVTALFLGVFFVTSFLLFKDKIGRGGWAWVSVVAMLSSLATYNSPRLIELNLKEQKLLLQENKQILSDIYAKADTVKKIAQTTAKLSVMTMTPSKIGKGDNQENLLTARDELASLLNELQCDESFVEETVAAANEAIAGNLLLSIHSRAQSTHWNLVGNVGDNEYLRIMNDQPVDCDALREYFGTSLTNDHILSERINRYERFIETKTIVP